MSKVIDARTGKLIPKPVPSGSEPKPATGVVTTVEGTAYLAADFDYFAKPGKLTAKPDDVHRNKLTRRASEHIALVNKITPDRLLKSPSEKHSENMRKKLRRRDAKQEAMKS
jgi:hypothetical protein